MADDDKTPKTVEEVAEQSGAEVDLGSSDLASAFAAEMGIDTDNLIGLAPTAEETPPAEPTEEPPAEEAPTEEPPAEEPEALTEDPETAKLRAEVEALKAEREEERRTQKEKDQKARLDALEENMKDPNWWGKKIFKDKWDAFVGDKESEQGKNATKFYEDLAMGLGEVMQESARAIINSERRILQALKAGEMKQAAEKAGLTNEKREALKQEFPWLSDMPEFSQEAAMLDLAKKQGAKPAPKPKVVEANADHLVESDQSSEPIVTDSEKAIEQEFENATEEERLALLGRSFVANRTFADW